MDLCEQGGRVQLSQRCNGGSSAQQSPGYLVRIGLDAEGLIGPRAPEQQLTARLTIVANRMEVLRLETIDA